MPAVGMESEFNVWVDGEEIVPEKYWQSPRDFITHPLLPRMKSSYQLPTGGAIYFDRGVIEVVTPLVEIAPRCSARVVRSLWEQIGFVREELTGWEQRSGHHVRLRGYSTHYNVSYEIPRSRQTRRRNVRVLAHLLAYILPAPLMLLATNRLSTGVGVRPRGDRIEITLDFTPDPALMVATATAIIGIVREVMSWDVHDVSVLDSLPFPRIDGVEPGKHTTRKGWLTKDVHYPRNPFTTGVEEKVWLCTDGRRRSMRQIGFRTAWHFRRSIRKYGDAFSTRLLFGVLRGKEPSMLDLAQRPVAYDHVGVLCRWGMVLTDLILGMLPRLPREQAETEGTLDSFVAHQTLDVRARFEGAKKPVQRSSRQSVFSNSEAKGSVDEKPGDEDDAKNGEENETPIPEPAEAVRSRVSPSKERRARSRAAAPERRAAERRLNERRKGSRRTRPSVGTMATKAFRRKPYPDDGLTRSVYEQVFLLLSSGRKLRLGNQMWVPVGMESWYRARLRRESDGRERTITVDQLVTLLDDWQ
jgi:hypothetical protein